MNLLVVYDTKIVECNHIIEVYKYEKAIKGKQLTPGNDKKSREKTQEVIEDNVRRSLTRTRQNLRNLINCNFDNNTSFLTLTFAKNIIHVEQANYEFKKFKQKLQRIYEKKGKKLKYVGVIEFQDGKKYIDKNGDIKKGIGRGAIHYHLLLFDSPYIDFKVIGEAWGNGFISINKCDDIDNMGAYLVKYMGKDILDPRLLGKKKYFASYKTLNKPKIYRISFNLDIENLYPKKNIVTKYDKAIINGGYENKVTYIQYNLKRENNQYERVNREDYGRKTYI